MGPPFVKGESAYFMAVNRNKKSVVSTCATCAPRRSRSYANADVVLDTRPGVMDRPASATRGCMR